MELLNTKQAAEKLGVSVIRVRQLIRDGKIVAQNLGRDYAIASESLANVITYGKAGRPPKAKDDESSEITTAEAVKPESTTPDESKPKRTKKAKAKKEKASV